MAETSVGDCAVCLAPLLVKPGNNGSDEIISLSCGHLFHKACSEPMPLSVTECIFMCNNTRNLRIKTIDCPMCRAPSRVSSKLILDVEIKIDQNQSSKNMAAYIKSLEKENRALKANATKTKLSYDLWRPKVKVWIAAQTQALKMQNSDLSKKNNNLTRKNTDQTLQINYLKSLQKVDLKNLQKQVMRSDTLALQTQGNAYVMREEINRLNNLRDFNPYYQSYKTN